MVDPAHSPLKVNIVGRAAIQSRAETLEVPDSASLPLTDNALIISRRPPQTQPLREIFLRLCAFLNGRDAWMGQRA